MVIYETKKVEVVQKLYEGTHQELIDDYNARAEFRNFVGGAIVTQEQLDEEIVVDKDENENDIIKKVSEVYYNFPTNDGRLFLWFMKRVGENAWKGCDNDRFYELADKYGIENIVTKSEMNNLRIVEEVEESEV